MRVLVRDSPTLTPVTCGAAATGSKYKANTIKAIEAVVLPSLSIRFRKTVFFVILKSHNIRFVLDQAKNSTLTTLKIGINISCTFGESGLFSELRTSAGFKEAITRPARHS